MRRAVGTVDSVSSFPHQALGRTLGCVLSKTVWDQASRRAGKCGLECRSRVALSSGLRRHTQMAVLKNEVFDCRRGIPGGPSVWGHGGCG